MIRGATLRLLHNPLPAVIPARLALLQTKGATAVALIPHEYCYLAPGTAQLVPPPAEWATPDLLYADIGQDPAHPFQNTPDPRLVAWACRAARALGLGVLLKPHLDSYYGAWRYWIVPGEESAFTRAYHRFLLPYVTIAQAVGADLCLGCELGGVTAAYGAGWWVALAAWVRRQGYRGKLTYAANWGWAADAEFRVLSALWPHLDYIGVDAYYPLTDADGPPSPDGAALITGWNTARYGWPGAMDALTALSRSVGKPLLFTEVGLSNYAGATRNPGADPPADAVRDDALQARYWQALHAVWDPIPEWAGYYAWEAGPVDRPQPDISHDVLGRAAEAVVWAAAPVAQQKRHSILEPIGG